MNRTRTRPERGMTLVEMIVAVTLATFLVAATLTAISSARRVAYLDEVATRLALAANAQIARLRAASWGELEEGESSIDAARIAELGFEAADGKTRGVVRVRQAEGLDLKEIVVRIERDTPSGVAWCEMATWRGKETR